MGLHKKATRVCPGCLKEKSFDVRHATCSAACGVKVRYAEGSATGAKETVLVISDLQYPFAHQDHLPFLKALKEKYNPTKVVCIGDEIDCHALSDYDHSPDGDSAGEEFKKALACMRPLYQMFPNVMSCISNHTARPFRRAYKYGIPKAFLKSYAEFLEAPSGWEWRDKWVIDDVLYQHGEGCNGKNAHFKAAQENMQSTVMGHLHANAGVAWLANPKCIVFGLAVGSLVDNDAYAFEYGKHIKSKPILGGAIIDKGIPMFVPMVLAPGGRWVGRL